MKSITSSATAMPKNSSNSSKAIPKATPIDRITIEKIRFLRDAAYEKCFSIFRAVLEAVFSENDFFSRLLIVFTGKFPGYVEEVVVIEKFNLQRSVFAVARNLDFSAQRGG